MRRSRSGAACLRLFPASNTRPNALNTEGPGGGLSKGVKLPPAPEKANPLDKISPVTDVMLQNPAWLTWRRRFDYQGFSLLKQRKAM